MSLCRHYVRELRRSVLVATPDLEKADSKSSTAALERLEKLESFSEVPLAEPGPSNFPNRFNDVEEKDSDLRLSAFLRSEGQTPGHSPQNSLGSEHNDMSQPPSNEQPPRDSSGTRADSPSPGHTVARADIRASAEKVLYTYLLPGAEREIVLPEEMVSSIINLVEDDGRDDPEVFDPAKDYVFQAMERDAFPGFLQAKALGNLVPLSIVARLAVALVSFGGGFWGAFYVVLRDQPKHIRCWVSLVFFFFFPRWGNMSFNANGVPGHFAICGSLVLFGLVPIQDRPHDGSSGVQRVHVHELVPDPGAVRTETAEQASVGYLDDRGVCSGRAQHLVHLCSGDDALISPPPLLSLPICFRLIDLV